MPSQDQQPVPIPESLRLQLEQFRKRLWRTKITEAAIAGVFGLFLSFLLVFGLDRLWSTPGWLRLLILLGGTSLFAVFAPYWLHRWVWKHRREQELARLIARTYPGLGDRLLGVIELQGQTESGETLSPRLRAAAMEEVAREAEDRRLEEAQPYSHQRKWAIVLLAVLIVTIAGIIVAPKAGGNAFKRWIAPLSSTERYTFTRLENVPTRLVIPHGEPFSVTLKLDEYSDWSPDTGAARIGLQPELIATRNRRSYHFTFPGQQVSSVLRVSIGDAHLRIPLEPTLRPAAESLVAEIQYPEYLQLPPKTVDLRSGAVTAVTGSNLTFALTASRDLASLTVTNPSLGPATDAPVEQDKTQDNPFPDDGRLAVKIDGRVAKAGPMLVGEKPSEIPFAWTDALGLSSTADFRVRVDAVPDAPSSAYLQGTERQRVMLADETIDLEVLGEDDFGVREVGLEWSGEFTRPTDQTPAKGELKLATGDPSTAHLTHPAAFSPTAADIKPQKLTLRAYSVDYLPGRKRSYSEPITLYILTNDEHAQMLKGKFDRIIGELEDSARKERSAFEENQRLQKLNGEELQKDENRKKLETQRDAERENSDRMRDLTKRTDQLFRDAMRNPQIDKDSLKKMAGSLQSMRELGQQDMPKVENQLNEAGDDRKTEEQAKKDLDQGVEKQKEVLEKMQKTLENANDANRNFEAGTFVNRLRRAATEQDGISASAWDVGLNAVGLSRTQVDPTELGKLDQASKQQARTASDVRWIQEDLGHYFVRSKRESYGKLQETMRNSGIDIGLEGVRRKLYENHTTVGSEQASQWANTLREWAKMLDDANRKEQSGSGQGQGQQSPEDEDFEFMVRVMRLIQQEQDLRDRTRALETIRRSIDPTKQP